jgi:ectoine hydroxylase-related dioxygenase (phytanoyl-CoA dioxygenase family)
VIDFDAHAERIARDGYTVLENVIEPELRCALAELERLEHDYEIVPSKNSSRAPRSGSANLLVHGRLFEQVPVY